MSGKSSGSRGLLVVDVGNTNITTGIWAAGRWRAFRRIMTTRRTADEFEFILSNVLSPVRARLSRAALCSVVPQVGEQVRVALERLIGPVYEVEPGTHGIRVECEPASSAGADRIANTAAAHALYRRGAPKIVVDFGTATTFDCVSPDGAYMGGVIMPGVEIAAQSLAEKTAKLPHITFAPVRAALGRNTVQSMQSGLFFGTIGAVKELLARLERELGRCFVVGTGGLAQTICPHIDRFDAVDPYLTLKGVKLLFDKQGRRQIRYRRKK